VELPGEPAPLPLGDMVSARSGPPSPAKPTTDVTIDVVAIPVLSLRPADSPRLNGEDSA